MNGLFLTFGVAVAAALGGIWLIGAGLRGKREDSAGAFRRSHSVLTRLSLKGAGPEARARRLRYLAAVISLPLVWLVTGWPVAAGLVVLGILGVPYLFGAGRQAKRRIDRLEALEEWTRRLADSMASGSGIVQTIVRSAGEPPEAIAGDVATLANRLSAPRWNKQVALRQFADSFEDALADQVAVALQIAVSTRGAQRVVDVLRSLAKQVSEEVEAQRAIEADRAEPRSVARNMLIILAVLVVGVVVAGQYTQPYETLVGQLVLFALGAATFGALVLMRRLQVGNPPPRIFSTDEVNTQ